ncbi:Putative acyl esterase [Ignavibacterium album JCM 16511]|uniref:Putative acyl esterase n=1 Tax=Ignavibacterium album (strain DSM 19864 / JCM 16511 / NBRC 101810 / Mat9-16) TaxID=945713 RepID=I0AM57_IGNAJ|nr:CocE/NonD family hydrolase [Ignavibacterium album]AFH50064.1 Putative acyl esterase [Ignavibacterium album JCM 16511]
MPIKSRLSFFLIILFSLNVLACAQDKENYIKENYDKNEYRIKMRDGIHLYTIVYSPKDKSKKYPIILTRTPYSVGPYGEDKFARFLGPAEQFVKEGYIFVLQDVRGRFMSEGEFDNMRPHKPNKAKNETDESSDTYDTIEWLVKNIPNNNGKVGMWGNSYPGFYTIMGAIDAHPNLAAVSPQAPISDWFIGDDMHHNGAFSLQMSFNFFKNFGIPRKAPTTQWQRGAEYPSPDNYTFFLKHTPIKKLNENILKNSIPFWDSIMAHGNYDYFWQERSNLKHLKNIKPAVLIVGGWYDAEDLFGPLNIYKTIEKNDKDNQCRIVMGPWTHGSWIATKGDSLGDFYFGSNTADYYRQKILIPFFNYYLKGIGKSLTSDAYMFNTGENKFYQFNQWPPQNVTTSDLFLSPGGKLSFSYDYGSADFSEYISDPWNPVPYTSKFLDSRNFYNRTFMIEDQRYVSTRPDVLTFETEPLDTDFTIAGPIEATLYVSTSSTDADFVVKVIDVYPDDEPNPEPNPNQVEMGGYQRLVRAEIMRGKFRNSYENPAPFTPNKIEEVKIKLNDAFHTFRKGHKIMIQIHSSWFPFFDSNPQTFTDIYNANEKDFVKAQLKVYHSEEYQSKISFKIYGEKQ